MWFHSNTNISEKEMEEAASLETLQYSVAQHNTAVNYAAYFGTSQTAAVAYIC